MKLEEIYKKRLDNEKSDNSSTSNQRITLKNDMAQDKSDQILGTGYDKFKSKANQKNEKTYSSFKNESKNQNNEKKQIDYIVHNQLEFDAVPKDERGRISIKPTENNITIVINDIVYAEICVFGNCHLISKCDKLHPTIKGRSEVPNSICAYENSSIEAYGIVSILAKDKSSVTAYNLSNSDIHAYDNSYVEAHNVHGRIYHLRNGGSSESTSVCAHDNSHVKAYGNTKVDSYDNSIIDANDNCEVGANDNSVVNARGNCTVYADDNVCVNAYGTTYVEGSTFGSNYSIKLYDRASAYADTPTSIVKLSNFAKILTYNQSLLKKR